LSRPLTRLDEITSIIQGGRHKKSGKHFVENGYPAYGAGGYNGDLDDFEFHKSGIVLSAIGARCGKCFFAEGKWSSLANTQVIFPDPEIVDSRFLWYQLNDENSWRRSGTAQPFIKPSDVRGRKVYVPTLDEQKRIAAILDKADAIRRKRQQAIQLADEFLRSVFLEMFGDPVLNPNKWPTKELGGPEVGILDRGKSRHRPRNDPALLNGPYPLIQTGDVANSGGYIRNWEQSYSELGLRQSKLWPEGTLCITIAANIAKTGILRFDACFPDSVVGFTPSSHLSVEFVQYWLGFLQKMLEAQAPESAQKNINLEILRGLKIVQPPPGQVERFTKIVQKTEEFAQLLSQSAALADTKIGSLSNEFFHAACQYKNRKNIDLPLPLSKDSTGHA